MHIEYGKIEGDVDITDELELHGMIAGNVLVKNSGYLILHGMVTKNLTIEEGGIATLHGTVSGDVYNRGGKLEVYGTIVGQLHNTDGDIYIDPKAAIHKRG